MPSWSGSTFAEALFVCKHTGTRDCCVCGSLGQEFDFLLSLARSSQCEWCWGCVLAFATFACCVCCCHLIDKAVEVSSVYKIRFFRTCISSIIQNSRIIFYFSFSGTLNSVENQSFSFLCRNVICMVWLSVKEVKSLQRRHIKSQKVQFEKGDRRPKEALDFWFRSDLMQTASGESELH